MKKLFRLTLIVALAIGMRAQAKAQDPGSPTVTITENGVVVANAVPIVNPADPSQYILPTQTIILPDGSVATVTTSVDTDPFLSYAFGVVNSSSTTNTFGFNLAIPITPVLAGSTITNHLSGGITDATGDGVTIAPVSPATGVADASINGVSAGIPVGPAQTSTGPGAFTYGPPAGFTASTISSVTVTSLDINLLFTLTGNFDSASLTGLVSATAPTAVPEPGTLALLAGAGISGLGVVISRRRCR
ncbi:MAG TPA: PEP-CTERM sorting domain-containing protein [Chthonomonadaceae bacterium]|nr:PEP-CTERM sorting domain-containing protein [Chthonomonadaceae bacterium]